MTGADPRAALAAGALAGVAMQVPPYVQQALGRPLHQDILRTWGHDVLGVPGRQGYLAGASFHEALSAAVGVAYAVGFDAVGAGAEKPWRWGLAGGAVHATIAAVVIAALPSSPPMTGNGRGHGVAYRRHGRRDVVTMVGTHLLYGAAFGRLYQALRR